MPMTKISETPFMRKSCSIRARTAFALVLAATMPPFKGLTMAADATHTLSGRIMDTSDNWLPDVQVTLTRAGVATRTDGNGLFELRFTSRQPLAAGPDGLLDTLQLEKEGYRPRLIPIAEAAYFEKPVAEKMAPNPIGADTVGFAVLMPRAFTIHGLPGTIGLETTAAITGEQLREALERVARRSAAETAEASFHAYVPPGVRRLRATFLISLHGMGSIDHPVLRKFAQESAVGLVGVEGHPVQRGCYPVDLLDAHLHRLGRLTGHPELATVPVLTFGHSNGTGFATVHAAARPERLIGWVSYHSGYSWQLLLPGVEKAPGLVMHGHLDRWLDHGQEQAVRDLRRQRNAPVAMMLEGNVGHGPVDAAATWEFIVAFCRAAMRLRLNNDGTLRPVAIASGWLGDRYDRGIGGQQELPIASYAAYAGDRADANWLPDHAFAEIWQRYGKTNPR